MVLQSRTKVFILCFAVVVVYLTSFSGVFQFDDYRMIVNYARAHSFASWLYFFSHNIRPMLKVSYTLNWLSGSGLFGFHLFNLAVHIINTLLVYFISLHFLSGKELQPYKNAAFLAALLFGLHPVQTEAVTYICGRSVSLMTMFYLAGMLAYIAGTENNKGLTAYFLSPVFFILAVLTRETALTLPAALLLWDLFRRREDGFGKILRRQGVHWVIFIIILGAVILNVKYEQLLNFSYELRGVRDNLFSQFNGLGYLLSRLVAVNGLNIDPDISAFTGWTPVLIVKAALILSMLAVAVVSPKNKRWLSFGILWFFLHLIPTNSIIPRLDIANERHMYLPVWGLFLIFAVGIEKLRVREQRSEIGSQKSEVGDQKTEIGIQKSEVGGQRGQGDENAKYERTTASLGRRTTVALGRVLSSLVLSSSRAFPCHSERSEESQEIKEQPSRLPLTSMMSLSGDTRGGSHSLEVRSTLSPSGGEGGGFPKIPVLIHTCVILLMFVLGIFTLSRNNDYRSEVAMWEDTIRKSPNKARCYNNLGYAYELEERYKEAKTAYQNAWNLDHDYDFAKNNLTRIEKILEGN
jgi:protein O-mannosyl-transferase